MNQQNELQRVIELLARWLAKIDLSTALDFYDINKVSENLSKNLLNEIFDYQLVNMNDEKTNYPGIDLGDKVNKIAFQITSRNDAQKIRDNLKKFVDDGLDKIYINGIRFLILRKARVIFGKNNYQEIYSDFIKEEHVIYESDLIKEIEKIYDKDKTKFKNIKVILENEFTELKSHNIQNFFFLNSEQYNNLKQFDNKIDVILDEMIPKYLTSQRDKYIEAKTFLNSNKQYFYDIYFPTTLGFTNNRTHKGEKIVIENVNDLFKISNFITIFGSAGSGKSTLMNHLLLNSIETYSGIPILIELRKLNDFDGTLIEYICSSTFYNKLNSSDKVLDEFLNLGKIIFLFDGYDELSSDLKQKRINEIEHFIDSYDKNKYIITSRPGTKITHFKRFTNTSVLELDDNQVVDFIRKQTKNPELEKRIIQSIGKPENTNYLHYLKNPLLLSMFILNFYYHPEVPKKKSEFYSDVFDTLFKRHDITSKSGFPRQKVSKLLRADFITILKIFSYLSYFDRKLLFDREYINKLFDNIKKTKKDLIFDNDALLEDLEVALSIFVEEGLEYKFPHRSLQEYFVALFIEGLNEDNKKQIYNENFNILNHLFIDNQYNLWDLCSELDKNAFTNHFLIFNLEKFKNKINNNSQEELYNSLLEVFNLEIHFDVNYLEIEDENNQYTGKVKHFTELRGWSVHNFSKYNNILTYLKIDTDFDELFFKTSSMIDFIEKYEYRDSYGLYDDYSIDFNKRKNQVEIKELLQEIGIIDFWKNMYENSKLKLMELNKELRDDDETDSFLINLNSIDY